MDTEFEGLRRAEELAPNEIDEAAVARVSGQIFVERLRSNTEFRARVIAAGRESAWYREYPEVVGLCFGETP